MKNFSNLVLIGLSLGVFSLSLAGCGSRDQNSNTFSSAKIGQSLNSTEQSTCSSLNDIQNFVNLDISKSIMSAVASHDAAAIAKRFCIHDVTDGEKTILGEPIVGRNIKNMRQIAFMSGQVVHLCDLSHHPDYYLCGGPSPRNTYLPSAICSMLNIDGNSNWSVPAPSSDEIIYGDYGIINYFSGTYDSWAGLRVNEFWTSRWAGNYDFRSISLKDAYIKSSYALWNLGVVCVR